MGDFGDCLEPREPDEATMAWARRVSREVQNLPPEPAAPADPAAEVQAALRQYDAAVAAGLFMLPDAPSDPKSCTGCGYPVSKAGDTLCRYCALKSATRLAAGTTETIPGLARLIEATAPPSARAHPEVPAGRRNSWNLWLFFTSLAKGLIAAALMMTLYATIYTLLTVLGWH